MSTKIHHGYRGRFDTLQSLNAVLERFREQAFAAAQEFVVDRLARDSIAFLDHYDVFGHLPSQEDSVTSDAPLSAAWDQFETAYEATKKPHARRDPNYDPDCSIQIIPDNDARAAEPNVYFLVFAEWTAQEELFASMPGIEWFPYWNNTDRPENVSQQEWDARKATWNRLLSRGVPARHGFNMEVCGQDLRIHPPSTEAVASKIPAFEERVTAIARDLALQEFVQAYSNKNGSSPRTSEVIGYLTEDTHRTDTERHKETVRQTLRRHPDQTDLTTSLTAGPASPGL